MNSTPTPKASEPHNPLVVRADEQIARAYEQIAQADEQLARLTEQLAKMGIDAARPPSAGPDPQPPPGRLARRALVGVLLLACIVVAALVLQSSYSDGAKLIVARWAPQFVSTSSLTPEAPSPAQPAPFTVASAEGAPQDATPLAQTAPQGATSLAQTTPQDATPPAQTAPQDAPPPVQTAPQEATPTATAALPDHTQLLQTIARDLANMQRDIEQLKANQQQTASDNSRAIEQLKASQEEMKRQFAKVSEKNVSKASPPPTQPATTSRRSERRHYSPYERALPRIPREWDYEEW